MSFLYHFPIFWVICQTVSIACALVKSKLKFSWGIYYRYNGLLNHNLDWVWIVTNVFLAKFRDIPFIFPNFEPKGWVFLNAKVGHGSLIHWFEAICKSSRHLLVLLKKKEQQYRNMIEKIMTNEMYTVLPELKEKRQKDRSLPDMIITLDVENVMSYLHRRKKMKPQLK